ncbi:rhodanese-like domain-containing protein [Actinokineospora xionganensis]|uniref:rhodanese-like domain-containing protein n=1 Tax=Actinokineospora xionganensis TaxID=2684470 RepID=UPI001C9C3883
MVREVVRREVRALIDRGAQPVEVLAAKEFDDAHLPGAVNIPLDELPGQAPSRRNRDRAAVVYCYDTLCDMSARGGAAGVAGFHRRLRLCGLRDGLDRRRAAVRGRPRGWSAPGHAGRPVPCRPAGWTRQWAK